MSAYITEMKVVAQKVGRGCRLLCPQVSSQIACSPPFQCCSSLSFLHMDPQGNYHLHVVPLSPISGL